jgi:hypothetical protein
MTNKLNTALYFTALAADNDFSRELIRTYGAAQASDKRYQRSHEDGACEAARLFKIEADVAWLAEMARFNSEAA